MSSLQEHLEKRSCIEQTGTDFLGGYGHLSTRSYALFKCRLKNVPLKQSLFSREEYPVYKNWFLEVNSSEQGIHTSIVYPLRGEDGGVIFSVFSVRV